MNSYALRSWTDVVALHPDVESDNLTESVFALDVGAIAANDKRIPHVNRDAEAFFRATYLTADLKRLLEVWLPRIESGQIQIENVEQGGRALAATGLHERMMELLMAASKGIRQVLW